MNESKTSGIALVLECLQEVGIKCTPLGKRGIVAEGVDLIKALSVPAFCDIITESVELLSTPTASRISPVARRTLFESAIQTIKEKGGSLEHKKECQSSTVEAEYHFVVAGKEVHVTALTLHGY